MTVKEMRDFLFAIDNENLTVKEMRAILYEELNQRLCVTADLFNRADVEDETPADSLYPPAWGVVSEDEQEQRVRY